MNEYSLKTKHREKEELKFKINIQKLKLVRKYLEGKRWKGRERACGWREELGFGTKPRELNLRDEADVETHVCDIFVLFNVNEVSNEVKLLAPYLQNKAQGSRRQSRLWRVECWSKQQLTTFHRNILSWRFSDSIALGHFSIRA